MRGFPSGPGGFTPPSTGRIYVRNHPLMLLQLSPRNAGRTIYDTTQIDASAVNHDAVQAIENKGVLPETWLTEYTGDMVYTLMHLGRTPDAVERV